MKHIKLSQDIGLLNMNQNLRALKENIGKLDNVKINFAWQKRTVSKFKKQIIHWKKICRSHHKKLTSLLYK